MPVQWLKISLDFYGISTHAAIQDLNMTGVPTSIFSAEALSYSSASARESQALGDLESYLFIFLL